MLTSIFQSCMSFVNYINTFNKAHITFIIRNCKIRYRQKKYKMYRTLSLYDQYEWILMTCISTILFLNEFPVNEITSWRHC